MNHLPNDILDGKSIGQLLAEGFEEFASEIKADKKGVAKRFTCHNIALDLHPQPYSPDLVKATRRLLNASQAVFAQFLGVSSKTVRSWEQGINTPSHSACRLMDEIRHNPAYWQARMLELVVTHRKTADALCT